MWIFISNIPEGINHRDLTRFIDRSLNPGMKGSLSPNRNQVPHCELMRITDRDTGQRQVHCLAEITPENILMHVTEQLNANLLNGKQLEVHKYQHRSPNKDRRKPGYNGGAHFSLEKRWPDRRHHNLSIEILDLPKRPTDPLLGTN
ncbi:hypothetical protein [Solemya velesiana gill symbiont]|uniref:RRM domain-containing protein n=1 Tax=Solemya velesiana gill symbiont TaxID=1918948 RepID=A0A1T2KY23_9GAMM|nr:hypothetical protein [Solemya velesiana gill symbiont]OOZ37745.1 hypothetical protein BOW51_01040 [Solemya velesiana gill symbiont]